ncbi:hypothetical protein AC579_3260 [Pseudocercospora musae]|uniref:Uncharacterized protein n=1 Tax=Pseudocercospora musae TaxID=113226 RepID=A0A139HZX8_9PEZI|nr:hypothetical protein AC579_3260 [Pseudocercospora musae]
MIMMPALSFDIVVAAESRIGKKPHKTNYAVPTVKHIWYLRRVNAGGWLRRRRMQISERVELSERTDGIEYQVSSQQRAFSTSIAIRVSFASNVVNACSIAEQTGHFKHQ